MKKEVFLLFVLVFLVSAGVFAQTFSEEISENVGDYIKGFVNGTGVNEDSINSINKINQSELPDNVEIKDIDENKIGIYEVNYTSGNDTKKIYVVTYSTTQFKEKSAPLIKNIQNIYFGYSESSDSADYLNAATGVAVSGDKGYVMLRPGSVTGISTSLDLTGDGKVFVTVYKNGESTGFHNLILSVDNKKIDFDIQSENAVNYNAGDIISVYVETSGDVNWGNAITIVETTS